MTCQPGFLKIQSELLLLIAILNVIALSAVEM